jgi:hypothetical protein
VTPGVSSAAKSPGEVIRGQRRTNERDGVGEFPVKFGGNGVNKSHERTIKVLSLIQVHNFHIPGQITNFVVRPSSVRATI